MVFENNFNHWVYFANQKLNRVNENENNNDDYSSQSGGSIDDTGSDIDCFTLCNFTMKIANFDEK